MIATLAAAAALNAPGAAVAATPCADREADAATLAAAKLNTALVCEINARRAARNLPALKVDKKLAATAKSFAAKLAKAGKIDHMLGRTTPGSRARAKGYKPWRTVTENLAWGQTTVVAVVDEWMNDAAHRATVLARKRDVGVAFSKGYWVQVVGRNRPAR